MDRRRFIGGVAICFSAAPLAAGAQLAGKIHRIGYLALGGAETAPHQHAAFWRGLRERGWVEGQNVLVETRRADGNSDRLPALAAELVRLNVELIVATSSAATRAARDATKTIPIVMAASANAVGEGLVNSLARPGGNITGMTLLAGPAIAGKQLELLKEASPTAVRVAALTNPTNRSHAAYTSELRVAARSLGVQLLVLETRSPDQFEGTFAAIVRERTAALLVLTDAMFLSYHRRLADLAARSRLPALYSQREFVEAGGLASYGPNLVDMFHRAAAHVDKILRGARPGDLPVEQPVKFELVINLKTAQAFGLAIPQSLLLRADEVLQ